ncbi:MAG: cytidylate kinase-like family protein [Candidatus Elarobacter sp.]
MIVTVSRAYGSSALAVSRAAADRLAYRLVDKELPTVVALRLGMSPDVVETAQDRPRSFGVRVLEQLGGGVPEVAQPAASTDDDLVPETRRFTEEAIREAAEAGNVVIVGRMAGAILGARPDVLRVFVSAPMAWRAAHVAISLGVGEAAAREEILRIDEARRTYAKEQYRVAWGDPRNYHLVLDTSRFGVDGCASIIVAAVHAAE